MSVLFNQQNLLAWHLKEYEYNGGERDFTYSTYLMLDTKTAQKITLEDVFLPNYEKELLAKLEKLLRAEDENKLFVDKTLWISKNFYFDDKFVYFAYQFDELSPYLLQPILVKLAWEEINHLKKN